MDNLRDTSWGVGGAAGCAILPLRLWENRVVEWNSAAGVSGELNDGEAVGALAVQWKVTRVTNCDGHGSHHAYLKP